MNIASAVALEMVNSPSWWKITTLKLLMNKRRASTGVSNRYRATTEESLQFVRQRREINKEAVALPVKNTGSEITRVCDEFVGHTASLVPPW